MDGNSGGNGNRWTATIGVPILIGLAGGVAGMTSSFVYLGGSLRQIEIDTVALNDLGNRVSDIRAVAGQQGIIDIEHERRIKALEDTQYAHEREYEVIVERLSRLEANCKTPDKP